MTTDSVAAVTLEQQWQRIMAWTATNAPATAAAVRSPASEAAVQGAAARIGRPLPLELAEFLRLADGADRTPAGYLLPAQRPMPAAEIADTWAMYQQVTASACYRQTLDIDPPARARDLALRAHSSEPLGPGPYDVNRLAREPAGTTAGCFLPSFVPIAEDGSGDVLFVDTRPGSRTGCVARYRKVEADVHTQRWPSIVALLGDTADALETGRPVGHWHPEVEDASVSWNPW